MPNIGTVTWEDIRELARKQEEARAIILEANPRLDRNREDAGLERDNRRVMRKVVRVQGRTDRMIKKAVRLAKRMPEQYEMPS